MAYGALALKEYAPLAEIIASRRWAGKVTELSINGPHDIRVRVAGKGYVPIPEKEAAFASLAWMERLCSFFAAANGIRWTPEMPLLACRTPDGYRFQALIGENVESKIACSIRVPRPMKADYSTFEIDEEMGRKLDQVVESGKAFLLSGGTGSGKTTLFNLLCRKIPAWQRVITAEDTRELDIINENRVHFIVSRTEGATKVSWPQIIDTVLRLNPDRFLVGELSIPNAFPSLQIMDTGHEGYAATMHANSPLDALRGFRRRVALGGGHVGTEVSSLMEFLVDNIGLVIQVRHLPTADNTERRAVTAMASPKDLLNQRDVRDTLAGEERSSDRRVDLPHARDALLAANAGEPLSPLQREVLRTLALLGYIGPSEVTPPAPESVPDAQLLSPEELTYVDAERRGALIGSDAPESAAPTVVAA